MVIKNNKRISFAVTEMALKIIILSKANQKETNNISFICGI